MFFQIFKRYSKEMYAFIMLSSVYMLLDLSIFIDLTYVLGHILPEKPPVSYSIFFILILLMLCFIYSYSHKKAIYFLESIISDTRKEIIEQIRNSELQSYEKIDKSGAYNIITLDTQNLADSAGMCLAIVDYFFLSVGALLYILFISQIAFVLTASIFVCGAFLYYYVIQKAKQLIHDARIKERELFDATRDIIEGFKELKNNNQKSDDFFHQYFKVKSAENRELRIKAEYQMVNTYVYMTLIEFGIFIPIIFILPAMGFITYQVMIVCITLILFLPLGTIKDAIPFLIRAYVSVERLLAFEYKLNQMKKEKGIDLTKEKCLAFSEINYCNISFNYTDKEGQVLFGLKNMSCTLYPNEIVFITGGNGSGKSTMLKLLTGLYFPLSGKTIIDGQTVQMVDNRHLFSAIFSDFHLFDRLYGLDHQCKQEKLDELLKIMELDHKLTVEDYTFSTLDLSTGQKKRLAMVVSILEDKPIYIFDEWAADQAPRFRQYFYNNLLPSLRNDGKTIIAVTHDDQYFHIADRILTLEYGQLI